MKLTSVRKRKRKDFNADRTKFIGGSDVGTILGLNPYKSMWTLWMEKTGRLEPEDISDNEPVWWGVHEEELVAERYCIKTGNKVRKDSFEWSLKEYPFLVGHFDRLIDGTDYGLECKTTSAYSKYDYENGEIPQSHYAQCVFYMAVKGCNKWDYAVKRDNTEFHVITIDRNEDEVEAIINACAEFWRYVEEDIEPPIDGSISTTVSLGRFYAHASTDDNLVTDLVGEEINTLLESREVFDESIAELEEAKRVIDNKLKRELEDSTFGMADNHTVTWKTQFRENFDKKRFKEDYPELYEEYVNITETRVLRVKRNKKK